jgi:hypothetical protein
VAKDKREPLVEAIAIGITEKQLAVSILTNLEIAKARIDALDFAVREEVNKNSYDRQFSAAVGVVRTQLFRALQFATSQLLSFATINEDVLKEVNKARKDRIKEEASNLHRLSEHDFSEIKEKDIRKLIAIKLGYNPAELGIEDDE